MAKDGLASEQFFCEQVSGTNIQSTSGTFANTSATTATFTTGNVTTATGTTATFASFSGNNAQLAGSITVPYILMPSGAGGLVTNFAARTAISGGDLVQFSGLSAFALGAFAGNAPKATHGIAVNATPVASGGTVPVLTHGYYPVTASEAGAVGQYAIQASGTNAIIGVATPTANTFGRLAGTVASGGTVMVIIGA